MLDHVRPTVVVRRRIYDPAAFHESTTSSVPEPVAAEPAITVAEPQIFERTHSFLPTQSWGASDEDESGPPSSVNVARALASLRSDELQRLEDLIRVNDEEEDDDGPTSSVIAPPVSLGPMSMGPVSRAPLSTAHVPRPAVRLPQQITLTDLARGMGIPPDELVTALVTHGFFTVAQSSVLGRDTARLAADMCGWRTTDMTDEEDAEYAARTAPPRTMKKRTAPAKKKAAAKRT